MGAVVGVAVGWLVGVMVGAAFDVAVGTGVGAVVAVALGATATVGERMVDDSADTDCGADWHAVSVATTTQVANKYLNIYLSLAKEDLRQTPASPPVIAMNNNYYNTDR